MINRTRKPSPIRYVRASEIFTKLDSKLILDAVEIMALKLNLASSKLLYNKYQGYEKKDLTVDLVLLVTKYLLEPNKRDALNNALKKDSKRNLFNNRQTY